MSAIRTKVKESDLENRIGALTDSLMGETPNISFFKPFRKHKKNMINDLNVDGYTSLISPKKLKRIYPHSENTIETVYHGRKDIKYILTGTDSRKIVFVGPCSIHNLDEAKEYTRRLAELSREVKENILLVERIYFEKPRTTIGWSGLLNDPLLDGSEDLNLGYLMSRELLLDAAEVGIPVVTEFLDLITPQYLSDLVSCAAIGARSTEYQPMRKLCSGLSMPVGFKNSTDGNVGIAVDAMVASSRPHNFSGINNKGVNSIISTKGNSYSFVILRGAQQNGKYVPNYYPESIESASSLIEGVTDQYGRAFRPSIVVDCSHGNAMKDYRKQDRVYRNVVHQIEDGNEALIGLMLESNIYEGNQDINQKPLQYGISVTDACIGWDETKEKILDLNKILSK